MSRNQPNSFAKRCVFGTETGPSLRGDWGSRDGYLALQTRECTTLRWCLLRLSLRCTVKDWRNRVSVFTGHRVTSLILTGSGRVGSGRVVS